MEVDTETPADLRRTVDALWRRKAWVIGAVGLAVLASLALSLRTTKTYAASAQVQLLDLFQSSVFADTPVAVANPQQIADSQIEVVESPGIARRAAERLGPRHSKVKSLKARAVGESTLLDIRVTSTSPAVARDGANAYAEAYSDEAQGLVSSAYIDRSEELESYAEELQQRIADLGARIDQLNNEIAPLEGNPFEQARLATLESELRRVEPQHDALVARADETAQRIDELRVEAAAQANSVARVVSLAGLPSDPVSPKPMRDAVIAAAIGLVVGLGLVFARESLGGAVSGPDNVSELLPSVPLLGATLDTTGRRDRLRHTLARLVRRRAPKRQRARELPVTFTDPASPAAEAYRSVRTSLGLVKERGVILLTSPAPLDGKTTTAVNLAASLAADGKRVILVSCDLRRPSLHEHFDLGNDVGVTSVLHGRATLDEALQPVPGTNDLLTVLASGPLPPNPSELLSSAAAGDLLRRLSTMADYVLVDSPPALALTDAVVTARWADAVVLVARQGFTSQRALVSTADLLRKSGADRVYTIVAGVPATRRSYSYDYYYKGSTVSRDGKGPQVPVAAPAPVVPDDSGAELAWRAPGTQADTEPGN
ncbi:MAG: polysaccharide biosynthesis tyrosine autokinase [Acidimicrobiia bacterium]